MSTTDLRVAFRVSVPTKMTNRPLMGRDHWSDQPTPPPSVAHEYTDPPDPFYRVWPPRVSGDKTTTAQERRIKQALFMVGGAVELDPARTRFTYTRCTLVGTAVLRDDTWSRTRRWNGRIHRPLDAMDAADLVLLVLRCALMTVYEIRPEHGTLDDLPLPGLSISLREAR